MDDRVHPAPTNINPAEIARRREAYSHAVANARLEGQFSSPENEVLFNAFIEGRIELDEILERLKARGKAV